MPQQAVSTHSWRASGCVEEVLKMLPSPPREGGRGACAASCKHGLHADDSPAMDAQEYMNLVLEHIATRTPTSTGRL